MCDPKVGDVVRFDVDQDGTPCWNMNSTSGGQAYYKVTGTVTIVRQIRYDVTYIWQGQTRIWAWPNSQYPGFKPNRQGWPYIVDDCVNSKPQPIEQKPFEELKDHSCICSTYDIFHFGCKCGAFQREKAAQ